MEKFHLPILQPNTFEPKAERKERELSVGFRIAKAYLFQKYPLSAKGKELWTKVSEVVEALKHDPSDEDSLKCLHALRSELPTVEDPHLDLFAELNVAPGDENLFFRFDRLANVQVTKGCRHQCEHCAADASKQVRFMPFAAVLKIAEKIDLQKHHAMVIEGSLSRLDELLAESKADPELSDLIEEMSVMAKKILENLDLHDSSAEAINHSFFFSLVSNRKWDRDLVREAYDELSHFEKKQWEGVTEFVDIMRRFLILLESKMILYKRVDENENLKTMLQHPNIKNDYYFCNYYDSDPFDYRDTAFLHRDGTPADYGDVVVVLAKQRRISITTAGWPVDDSIAQRAAEKIVKLGSNAVRELRISVHPFETGTSTSNPVAYRKNMENAIRTLAPLNPTVIFLAFDEKKYASYVPEIRGLRGLVVDLGQHIYGEKYDNGPSASVKVSRYSGRTARDLGQDTEDFDVMSCMPGIHIWPDGTVHRQSKKAHPRSGKGLRPRFTGKRIFSLTK